MTRMLTTGRALTLIALAGALAGGLAAIPAQAATATPTVTIGAKSALPSVTGDTYVVYKGPEGTGTATLSGQVTGATSGEVLTLSAKPFRTSSYKPTGKSLTLNGTSPESYTFKVKPTIATSYRVSVSGAKASVTVYVTEDLTGTSAGKLKCHGATCRWSIRIGVILPASALRTESRKRWFLYVGALTAKGNPPKYVILSRRSRAGKAVKINSHEYAIKLTFFGPSRHHTLGFVPDACTKDTEARDGMGLPGHHGCGKHRVKLGVYLG